ncbi:MAG: diaminopimelate dehydrogenase [Desulfovibrionaceae bacterium]|nr:diaminopimelate dehydrogenase [Desulfovibrionaceae bacterium]
MKKFTVAIHSFGNIGRRALEAALSAPDCECLGVIRRRESLGTHALELRGVQDFASVEELAAAKGRPDVIILCGPSRSVPDTAADLLARGYSTVDSFDIHGNILDSVNRLEAQAMQGGAVAITAAGWDPGTDSVLRALFEAMVPTGTTFTNFGRGRSMGHSVAARAIKGVANATSITIPVGGGRHARLVYVVLEEGENLAEVTARIKADDYFAHDDLTVRQCADDAELATVADQSHGVLMERTGASGMTDNQILKFDMRINNPALTGQVLLSCARAATRMEPGCYTLIDIPPVKLLPGERKTHIKRFV